MIYSDCHRQIHEIYTNQELAMRLTSIEKLQQDKKLAKFIRFIKKQPFTKRISVIKLRERQRK